MNMDNKVICISGIDGSGKSTIIKRLQDFFINKQIKFGTFWLRYNHFYSKPLLMFARIFSYTKYYQIDGIRIGYHNFHNSKLLSKAFIYLQYLDAKRARAKIKKWQSKHPGAVVILDRFIYDILVDLMIDCGDFKLLQRQKAQAFLKLELENTTTIVIKRKIKDIMQVRPECRIDKNFNNRYQLYQQIAALPQVQCINNQASLDQALEQLFKIIGVEHGKEKADITV